MSAIAKHETLGHPSRAVGGGAPLRAKAPRWAERLPLPTDRLALGASGLQVSPFCLGIVHTPDAVLAAFDAGINFFFVTTDMHWPIYEALRTGLAQLLRRGGGIRDEIVVVGTTYVAPSAFLVAPFHELVHAVPGLDRIDVCTVGGCYADDPPARRTQMVDHRANRFAGCRAIGASFHERALVAPACNAAAVDIGFVRYNAGHAGARNDVFPRLEESPTLLYGFKSMGGWVDPEAFARIPDLPPDIWQPIAPDHYRFALSGGGLDGILCSPATPTEVRELIDAMTRGPLDEDEREHMIDLALLAQGDARMLT